MMAALQEQNAQNMLIMQKHNSDVVQVILANMRPGIGTDSNGIGSPITFKAEEKRYAE